MDATSMRQILAEQINRLHSGKGDPKVANSICNSVGKIISTVRIEMEYCKRAGVTPSIGFIKHSGPQKKLPKK